MKTVSIIAKCIAVVLCLICSVQQSLAQLSVSITGAPVSLSANGTATLTAVATGGTPPYSYNWYNWQDNISSSNPFSVIGPGIYTVVVMDATQATATATTDTIFNIDPFTATITSHDNNCANYCSGNIQIDLNGGRYFTVYLNNVPTEITQVSQPFWSKNALCAGSYNIRIENGINAAIEQTIIIAPDTNPPLSAVLSSDNDTIWPDARTTMRLKVTGGKPPYYPGWVYKWSRDNDTMFSYNKLLPGPHQEFSVSDADGCTIPSNPITIYGYSGPVAFPDYIAQSPTGTYNILALSNDKIGSYYGSGTNSYYRITINDIVKQPEHGTAAIVNVMPQYIRYIHDGSNILIDSFQYKVCDTFPIPNCDTETVYFNTLCQGGPAAYCMWPGDADNSGMVDNNDLLAIGLGYDVMGYNRSIQGNTFMSTPTVNWHDTLPDGTNMMYTDCNGDGTVNAADTVAIIQNFSYETVRSTYEDEWRSNIPILELVSEQDSLQNGDTLTIDLYLGDSNNPVTDAYGIAFTINYDPLTVDTTQTKVTFGDSWFGNASDKISIAKDLKAIGQIKCALTRIDHNNRSGQGPIGSVSYVITTDNINGKDLGYYRNIVSLSNITLISNNSDEIPVNAGRDTSVIEYEITGINETVWSDKINLYPNPAKDMLVISSPQLNINSVNIVSVLGEVVLAIPVNSGKASINTSSLQPGIYFTELHTEKGIFTKRLMIVR